MRSQDSPPSPDDIPAEIVESLDSGFNRHNDPLRSPYHVGDKDAPAVPIVDPVASEDALCAGRLFDFPLSVTIIEGKAPEAGDVGNGGEA